MQVVETSIRKILTRTSGYLQTVSSHSMQPYQGCSLGRSLCGVGCYVQHNGHLTRGRAWGSFVEARLNAADSYREHVSTERAWARRSRGRFAIFLSSSTEPFLPQETRYRVTESLLRAMVDDPPDELIVQTHSHRVADYIPLCQQLHACCRLRVHVSIETDREQLPGLPPHASSVARRMDAARRLKEAGIQTVVTVSPLLPIANPEAFFGEIAAAADAVVIDHFIEGDGSPDGRRTLRTALPAAMIRLDPVAATLDYRDRMVSMAQRYLPGRVGVNIDGFAGRYLPAP